jgi:hypothetical protein
MRGLGELAGGVYYSSAWDVSRDGSVVVGRSSSELGIEAVRWDAVQGMRRVKDILESDFSLDLDGWTLEAAAGLSDDGRHLVGTATNPAGVPEAWLAEIPQACRDGRDDDGDGATDFPADPGCASALPFARESPSCENGRDDDGDGLVDWRADPECASPSDPSETPVRSCGLLGVEALALWALAGLRASRRR